MFWLVSVCVCCGLVVCDYSTEGRAVSGDLIGVVGDPATSPRDVNVAELI
jgi:hypothetical protein